MTASGPEIRRSSVYLEDVKDTLSRGAETGLYTRADSLRKFKTAYRRANNATPVPEAILGLSDLRPVFLIWCFGIILSVLELFRPEIRRSSVYLEDVKDTLSRGAETGLYTRADSLRKFKTAYRRANNATPVPEAILGLSDLRPVFLIWCFGIILSAVQRGPAPRTESKATQVSPEVLAVALQSPTPQQRQQLPLVSGGSAPAASRPRDRQGAPLAASTPRCPPREKERESRPNSRERASSKDRHHAAPSTAEGRGRMELGDVQPSTSAAAPLSEGGRGRGVRPRTSTLPKPTQQASSQEVEARDEATEPSALSSDQDDMEWEISKTKKKTKKTVIPPK
ncbi:hypothetical protein ISCGN_026964 [Ixodes scapularis]